MGKQPAFGSALNQPARLVGRVQGANFGAIYGKTKAMAYHSLSLPKGHTWESYTKFLLDTLPSRLRKNYIKKFQTSIEFWHKTGGGLEEGSLVDLISSVSSGILSRKIIREFLITV